MLQALLLLTGLSVALYSFKRWSDQVGPARTRVALRWLAVGGGALLIVFLVARGAASLMWPLLVLLIPYLVRIFQTSGTTFRTPRGTPSQASSSVVETRFLRMSLNHDSGEMVGEVVNGPFAGRSLADLNRRELLALWQGCRDDPQSVAVLEAYLDRAHDDWRDWSEAENRVREASVAMSREDALEVLGLDGGASREEIKTAHRRLMQRLHPDHGGSTYLAARVNQAKDLLLND